VICEKYGGKYICIAYYVKKIGKIKGESK